MIVALLALALALPAIVFVVWPLIGRREPVLPSPADETRAGLEAEKVQALRAIRELETEHQAGLLTDAHHDELRARYEARASAVLRRLDALPPPTPPAAPARARAVAGGKAGRREAAPAPAGPPARVPWAPR